MLRIHIWISGLWTLMEWSLLQISLFTQEWAVGHNFLRNNVLASSRLSSSVHATDALGRDLQICTYQLTLDIQICYTGIE